MPCPGWGPFDSCSGHSCPCEWPGRVSVHSTCSCVLFFKDCPIHRSVFQSPCTLAAGIQDFIPRVRDPCLPREDHVGLNCLPSPGSLLCLKQRMTPILAYCSLPGAQSFLHSTLYAAAAAAAKSLQSCPTLCHPIDGSPPGSPVPGILQARTLEWVAISFSNA